MEIRRFLEYDQEAVYKLIHDILLNEFKVESTAYKMNDLKNISKTYGGERDVFLVAEKKDKIIGTVAIKEEDKEKALLRRLFIDPAFRRLGYGIGLIKYALEFCYEEGFKKVVFNGTSSMERAINLCEKAGFMRKDVIDMRSFQLYRYEKLLRGTKEEILDFITHR